MSKGKDHVKKDAIYVQDGVSSSHDGLKATTSGKKFFKKKQPINVEQLEKGLLAGNSRDLAKAITLIESSLEKDQQSAQALLQKVLQHEKRSIRIGISGVPGSGKSTFIEAFG